MAYDGPMDMIGARRGVLEKAGAIRGVGLEIGAYARPTVSSPNMLYLDFFATEVLRENATRNGEDAAAVVPVSFVVEGEDYRAAIGDQRFDFIVANHVFEHIVNPVAWLQMLGDLLNADGHLLLTIPDRTPYCFDRFRQPTTFAHLMWDYLSDLTHAQKAWVHAMDTNIYYDRSFINQVVTPDRIFDPENMKKATHHPGVHCHVFESGSFLAKVLKPLLYKRIVDFSLVTFEVGEQWGEFYVLLRKGWAPFEFTLEEFYGHSLERPRR